MRSGHAPAANADSRLQPSAISNHAPPVIASEVVRRIRPHPGLAAIVGRRVAVGEIRDRGTRILQGSGNTDATCLHFEVIADTAQSAEVTLTLDFDDDGEADWEQTLPESDWETYELWVEAPLDREGIIFGVEKRGSGRAVLAQLNVTEDHACEGR